MTWQSKVQYLAGLGIGKATGKDFLSPLTDGPVAKRDLISRCKELDWRELLWLYRDLGKDDDELTAVPAHALREKARAGELPDEVMPILIACLVDARSGSTICHLAKALAAFGRDAGAGAPYLAEKINDLHVTDDVSFWNLDGCLHALAHLGGETVAPLLDELETRQPSPVTRAGSVYQGQITEEDRRLIFSDTLERVRAMASDPALEPWRDKRTDRAAEVQEARGKMAPWMTR